MPSNSRTPSSPHPPAAEDVRRCQGTNEHVRWRSAAGTMSRDDRSDHHARTPTIVRRQPRRRRRRPRRPGRGDLRVPRPERSRQVDHGQGALHVDLTDRWHRHRGGLRRRHTSRRHPPADRRCAPGSVARPEADRSRTPATAGHALRPVEGEHQATDGRRDRPRRHRHGDRRPRRVVLGWHEAAPRPGDVAHPQTADPVPRRARRPASIRSAATTSGTRCAPSTNRRG